MSEFRSGGLDDRASASVSLAAVIRQLATELADDDLVRMGTALGDLARRDPGAMFAGSVALGFRIARIRGPGEMGLDGSAVLRAVELVDGARRGLLAEEHLDLSANAGGETPPSRADDVVAQKDQ
jgi:hypothetical protein